MEAKGPNILLIMADQMAGPALPCYGHSVVQAPNITRLAQEGVVFDSTYSASPLCAPSRAALVTGQLPSRIGAYDNAAEFSSSIPTFGHYLRAMGYHTCLCGKMHFIEPDQLLFDFPVQGHRLGDCSKSWASGTTDPRRWWPPTHP
jgi:choline-sulfatase